MILCSNIVIVITALESTLSRNLNQLILLKIKRYQLPGDNVIRGRSESAADPTLFEFLKVRV